MANPNGAANAGMYAATAGLNGMPAAGHYSDMQTLMQNMETLSGWLQQNREDFIRVQEGLEHVERRNVSCEAYWEGATFRDRSFDTLYRLDIHRELLMETLRNVCTSHLFTSLTHIC